MKCPNCAADAVRSRCHACGLDIQRYDAVLSLSNSLYNKGLAQIKARNLEAAIVFLSRCVQFNKSNINARNLLGIALFEYGQVGEAIKQWVLSVNIVSENNPAQRYLNSVQNNAPDLDRLNEALNYYNQGLQYLRAKSEDMAIIQLKKSLELNPVFIDALNLLSLAYMTAKDYKRALTIVNRVLELDPGNSTALRYYKELGDDPATTRRDIAETLKVPKISGNLLGIAALQGKTSLAMLLIAFAVGALLTFFIVYFIVIPSAIGGNGGSISDLRTDYEAKEAKWSSDLASLDASLKAVSDQLAEANNGRDELLSDLEQSELKGRLYYASYLLSEGNLSDAAQQLIGIDKNTLHQNELDIFSAVAGASFPSVEKIWFEQGTLLFNQTPPNHSEAKTAFEQSLEYETSVSTVADDCYYYLGRIAEAEGQSVLAKGYYEKIMAEYPDSNQRSNVERRLRELAN